MAMENPESKLEKLKAERHEIAEKLKNAMGNGTDMSMTKYAKLNERYHWLNEKIMKLNGKAK